MARAINHEDERQDALDPDNSDKYRYNKFPIQQIVFYQSGIGTENNLWSEYVDGKMTSDVLSEFCLRSSSSGATGASLGRSIYTDLLEDLSLTV